MVYARPDVDASQKAKLAPVEAPRGSKVLVKQAAEPLKAMKQGRNHRKHMKLWRFLLKTRRRDSFEASKCDLKGLKSLMLRSPMSLRSSSHRQG